MLVPPVPVPLYAFWKGGIRLVFLCLSVVFALAFAPSPFLYHNPPPNPFPYLPPLSSPPPSTLWKGLLPAPFGTRGIGASSSPPKLCELGLELGLIFFLSSLLLVLTLIPRPPPRVSWTVSERVEPRSFFVHGLFSFLPLISSLSLSSPFSSLISLSLFLYFSFFITLSLFHFLFFSFSTHFSLFSSSPSFCISNLFLFLYLPFSISLSLFCFSIAHPTLIYTQPQPHSNPISNSYSNLNPGPHSNPHPNPHSNPNFILILASIPTLIPTLVPCTNFYS